jgi:flagellin
MVTIYNASGAFISNSIDRFSRAVNSSIEKISTGQRINSAKDSPSEISLVTRFDSRIKSEKQLVFNLQDMISMFQTADYAITGSGGISDILNTVRDKIVYAGNSTLTSQDVQNIQSEIEDLIDEISNIINSTEFNSKKLLNGELIGYVTSSSSEIAGYVNEPVSNSTYTLENITGATYHEIKSTTASNPTADTPADYTDTLGTLGTVSVAGSATASGNYEVIFTDSASFKVYDNSDGTLVTSGTTDAAFTVDGLSITVSSGGTYADGFKFYFDTTSGSGAISATEGNRGTSEAITAANFDSNAMLNSYFYIKTDFDSGSIKYNVFDSENNQMGNWTTIGSEFTSFADSKLAGSSFTFSVTNPGKEDIWKVDFGTFNTLSTSGGTFVIEGVDKSISISWQGVDTLNDIANSINNIGDGLVSASAESGVLVLTAQELGAKGKLRVYDTEGNFVSTSNLAETSGTGNNASLTYNGTTYTSEDNYFKDVIDNITIEVAKGANLSSATLSVTNKTSTAPLNIDGGNLYNMYVKDLTPEALGLKNIDGGYTIDVGSSSLRSKALSMIDLAIEKVSGEASRIGSNINTLDYHLSTVQNTNVARKSALSTHLDTDLAQETTNLAANQLKLQISSSMLAQSNISTQRVLELLGIIPTKQ